MNDNQKYVVSLCEQLTAKGKPPTTALIKSLSKRPVPLPDILSVLKNWKESPDALRTQVNTPEKLPEDATLSLEERVSKLEDLVARLQKHIEGS